MIVYRDISLTGTPEKIQEFNLNLPSVALSRAMEEGVPFILVSKSSVFDISKKIIYDEQSKRNSKTDVGKILSIIEDKTLDYDKGFVIRVRHLVSDIISTLSALAAKRPPSLSSFDVYPTSDEVLDYVIGLIQDVDWSNKSKVIHLPSIGEPLASIVMRMAGGEYCFNVDREGHGLLEMGDGVMVAKNFTSLFGATEFVNCLHANEYYTSLKFYGDSI